ncbi:MAG: hypothetical protein IOMNBAOH_00991 [Rhodocyclaceae bacterium]|nr:hypothetical protein [Rhodocyclaceae bacterium]
MVWGMRGLRGCGRAARGLAALWQGVARHVRRVRKIGERQRLRATLSAMSRRELADIGLARGDIERVVRGLPPPCPRPPRASGMTIDDSSERNKR